MFGGPKPGFQDVWHKVEFLIDNEDGDPDEASDANGEKGKSDLTKVKAIQRWIDQREDLEERIEDAIRQ